MNLVENVLVVILFFSESDFPVHGAVLLLFFEFIVDMLQVANGFVE